MDLVTQTNSPLLPTKLAELHVRALYDPLSDRPLSENRPLRDRPQSEKRPLRERPV